MVTSATRAWQRPVRGVYSQGSSGIYGAMVRERDMSVESEMVRILADGVDQGTAKAVTIGTTAAAVAAWRRIRIILKRQPSLDSGERAVLAAEPGQQVDLETLLRLLSRLPAEAATNINVQGDYVARDKIMKFGGDYVDGNKISRDWDS